MEFGDPSGRRGFWLSSNGRRLPHKKVTILEVDRVSRMNVHFRTSVVSGTHFKRGNYDLRRSPAATLTVTGLMWSRIMSKVVLIIEDEESRAKVLRVALAAVPGLEPRAVPSIHAALKAFEQQPNEIAAVVTDLPFPESNGLELIRHLRSEPRYARVQILLVSGDSEPNMNLIELDRALRQLRLAGMAACSKRVFARLKRKRWLPSI
jgi:CheY-like chemotaxis protein